jgi:hypothetical protein
MGLVLIAVFILAWIVPAILSYVNSSQAKRTKAVPGLFVNNFIDSKVLFLQRFKEVPSVGVVTHIDSTRAYAFLSERLGQQVVNVHQLNMFDHNEQDCYFTMTIFELANKRMIELGNGYAEVLYTRHQYEWAMALLKDLATCKVEIEAVEVKAPTVVGFARAFDMN